MNSSVADWTPAALWLAVVASGLYHGLNPGMGWPLAVSAGLMERSSRALVGALWPLTVGHLLAMLVVILPFALLDLRGFSLGRIETVGWLSVLYYGAVATVIAYILWGDGALRIPASRTGIATAALPVTALVLSALVLGETLRPSHLAGCAAVLAGIIIAQRRPRGGNR